MREFNIISFSFYKQFWFCKNQDISTNNKEHKNGKSKKCTKMQQLLFIEIILYHSLSDVKDGMSERINATPNDVAFVLYSVNFLPDENS